MIPDRCRRSASTQTAKVWQNWNTIAVGTSLMRALMASRGRASTSPSAMLPSVTTSSVGSTLQPETKPLTVAATARR